MKVKAITALAVSLLVTACAQPPATARATTPVSAANALAALTIRAQQGDDKAALALALYYYRTGNTVLAFHWAELAAKRGYAPAEAGVGHAYTSGLGVPQDYHLALKYNQLAADQNDSSGLNNLAFLYEHGYGVPADLPKAAGLYRRSAMLGNVVAESALGRLYAQGTVVPLDPGLAYFWDSLAAAKMTGPPLIAVVRQRDVAAAQLSPDMIAALQAAATNWKPGTEPPAGHPVTRKPHGTMSTL